MKYCLNFVVVNEDDRRYFNQRRHSAVGMTTPLPRISHIKRIDTHLLLLSYSAHSSVSKGRESARHHREDTEIRTELNVQRDFGDAQWSQEGDLGCYSRSGPVFLDAPAGQVPSEAHHYSAFTMVNEMQIPQETRRTGDCCTAISMLEQSLGQSTPHHTMHLRMGLPETMMVRLGRGFGKDTVMAATFDQFVLFVQSFPWQLIYSEIRAVVSSAQGFSQQMIP